MTDPSHAAGPSGRSLVGRTIRYLLSFIPSAQDSEPREEAAASSSHISMISSSTDSPQACYDHHMKVMKHGIPIWIPEPNENSNISYRKQGTSIGDVVRFTPGGALDFLFNVCHPSHHPINSGRVPEGFNCFIHELTSDDTIRYQEYEENSYLASKLITETTRGVLPNHQHDLPATHPNPPQSLHEQMAIDGGATSYLPSNSRTPNIAERAAGVSFKSSASEGAILTMPEGAYSEDLTREFGLHQYISENIAGWYKYARESRRWNVKMGDLHLVTGIHKANAWGIATFRFAEETTKVDVNLQLKAKDIPPYGTLYEWDYSFKGVTASPRSGPNKRQLRSLFRSLPEEERGQSFENQCLFVRTVNSAVTDPQEMRDLGENGAQNEMDNPSRHDLPHGSGWRTESTKTSADPSTDDAHRSLPGGSNIDYNLKVVQNGPVQTDHPSKAINDFLLKEKPNGRVVITHDRHWISLLTENDVVFPTGDELVARLTKTYSIVEDKGILSLEAIASDIGTKISENSQSISLSMPITKTELFAVLIGINKYNFSETGIPTLRGPVPDALAFQSYLENGLGVPSSQITVFTDEMATRSAIIGALNNLADDSRISSGDAILIFYAGHGVEIDSPNYWRSDGKTAKINAIVPYDCNVLADQPVQPIPYYELEVLLSKIADKKGDNITVIFDCPHSGPGARGSYTPSGIRYHGLGSHVLLAACSQKQMSRERNGRGIFSTALLDMLNQVSPDSLRYSDILRHPDFGPTLGQDPQCEGLHTNRILFSFKVFPAQWTSFPISFDRNTKDDHKYVVHGGTIHNVTLDSEFAVYLTTDINLSKRIVTLEVDKLGPFSFMPKFPPNAPKLDLTLPAIAVQTKFGAQERLRIHIPPRDGFHEIYHDLLTNSQSKHIFEDISHTEDPEKAQVEVTLTADKEVKLTTYTEVIAPTRMTITQIVDSVAANPDSLMRSFSKIAHLYRGLKYVNNDPMISRFIEVNLFKLHQVSKVDENTGSEDTLEAVGPNLYTNGGVTLLVPNKEAGEVPYGIRVINRSGWNLYLNLFYFNCRNLSITSFATSDSPNGYTDHGLDMPLERKGGIFEIGFGTAGYSPVRFAIASGSDVEIGFLKIYLSTQPANLAYLPQLSPFTSPPSFWSDSSKPNVTWSDSPERKFTPSDSLKRKFIWKDALKREATWTDIVIPIILRRH